ncbi:MAG: Gfo/Idh/MocA family oxidoreductase [Verrucomicrobiae bacterium]|nr:Gfo/Idh/MocA family oxidoreductase [Verrucomicrobiae bacterium]
MNNEKKVRIGVLGLHHDHVWSNLEELARLDTQAELVGAADPHPELRDKYGAHYGGDTYPEYEALLDSEDLDAVYIFASNRVSEDLAVMACERGLHCLVEKPMASTLAGADRMLAASEGAGVRLMINWPFAWWPQLQRALTLAGSGEIGQLWQVKYRAAHEGPVELGCSPFFCEWLYDETLNGAGALMDYCCYGSLLAQVLLGKPSHVSGVKLNTGLKPDLKLEDNAILMMSYPEALATTEASWTQIGKLTAYTTVIYGSEGTLMVEPRHGASLYKATADEPEGVSIPVPEVAPEMATASAHFLHLIENPEASVHPLCGSIQGRDAQEILEAGLIAAREGKSVRLPLV